MVIIILPFWFLTVAILLSKIEKLLYTADKTTSFMCQNSILVEHLSQENGYFRTVFSLWILVPHFKLH